MLVQCRVERAKSSPEVQRWAWRHCLWEVRRASGGAGPGGRTVRLQDRWLSGSPSVSVHGILHDCARACPACSLAPASGCHCVSPSRSGNGLRDDLHADVLRGCGGDGPTPAAWEVRSERCVPTIWKRMHSGASRSAQCSACMQLSENTFLLKSSSRRQQVARCVPHREGWQHLIQELREQTSRLCVLSQHP